MGPLGRHRNKWKHINMHLQEIGRKGMGGRGLDSSV